MGGCQGPSREVLKAAGLRQARWRPDQRLRLLVHTDTLWREDFHRPPTASVGSRLIDGHGRGISASPLPPPTQQSSWSAAPVPPIRDHYADSPPPQDRGLDASFPPGLAHAQSVPTGREQPAVPGIFLSMSSSTQETQVTTSFIFVPLQPFCTQLSSSESTTGVMSSAHAEALGVKPLCSPAPLAASREPPRALRPAVCHPCPKLSQRCPHPGAQSRARPSWPHLSVSFLKASLSPTGSKRDQPSLPSFPPNKAGSAEHPPSTSLSPGGPEGSKPVPATQRVLLWMHQKPQEISPIREMQGCFQGGRRHRSWLLPVFY